MTSFSRNTQHPAAGTLPSPVRRRRPLLAAAAVLLGLLVWLVVASGLERASERIQIWSLAADVERGETVQPGQLVPTEVAVSTAAGLLEVLDVRPPDLGGGLWAADLPAGTLLSSALVLDTLPVAADQALVGLALPPGGWPTPSLRAGDAVSVLRTAGEQPGVVVDRAIVEVVTMLGDAATANRLVTVTVPSGSAAEVTKAAAAGEVALVVVP